MMRTVVRKLVFSAMLFGYFVGVLSLRWFEVIPTDSLAWFIEILGAASCAFGTYTNWCRLRDMVSGLILPSD